MSLIGAQEIILMLLDNSLQPFVIITKKAFTLYKNFFYFIQVCQDLRRLTVMNTRDFRIYGTDYRIVVLRNIRFIQVLSKFNEI